MTTTLEKRLETRLVNWVRGQGGTALKGSTIFDTGFPDRIVYLPGVQAYVELKGTSTAYLLTEKQKVWAGRIISSRAFYYIIESYEMFERFKEIVYKATPPTLMKNTYLLNGFQLEMHVNSITNTFEVLSYKDDKISKLLSGKMGSNVADTIYFVLKKLEEVYPKKNYSEM